MFKITPVSYTHLYHNHHVEFAKYDGKYIMDIMAEESDPKYLGFELDVHWLQRGGVNPLEWIKKLEGRTKILHIKDYRIAQTLDLSCLLYTSW